MLSKSYAHCFIGKNYLSVLHAITLLSKSQTCVLIDDKDLSFANKWYLNIGEIEKNYLMHIGKRFHIPEIANIEEDLRAKKTILIFNRKMIELGESPFHNLKELIRKIPEFYNEDIHKILSTTSDKEFDELFHEYVREQFFVFGNMNKQEGSEAKHNVIIQVLNSFNHFLAQGPLIAKQLHNVLQMMFQSIFSSELLPIENAYLLISLLGPRYEVQESKLETKLIQTYGQQGGALKKTGVKDWGFEKGELEFICLKSLDGVLSTGHCFYYAQTVDEKPFKTHYDGVKFRSIELKGRIDHQFIEFFSGKRIVFSKQERMGTDFPYWELSILPSGELRAVYAFSDFQGTKPDFYYHHAIEDIFQSLSYLIPGIERAEWLYSSQVSEGSDSWVRVGEKFKEKYPPGQRDDLLRFYSSFRHKSLLKIENCGPNRSKSLGLYGQLLDIFSDINII